MLSAAVPIRHDRLEPSTIVGGNLELDPCAHAGIVAEPDVQRDSYDCISALEITCNLKCGGLLLLGFGRSGVGRLRKREIELTEPERDSPSDLDVHLVADMSDQKHEHR